MNDVLEPSSGENADRMEPDKATLVAEEDIREQVTIPAEFLDRHLWSPSDLSSPALNAAPANWITVSPFVVAQACAALFNALSPSSQLSSVPPRPAPAPPPPAPQSTSDNKEEKKEGEGSPKPDPLPEPVVTLYCPFDHTAGVIDALVRSIAQSEQADVLVLDALTFTHNNDLGPGFEKYLNALFGIGKQNNDEFKSRQAQRFLRAMINAELPMSSGDEKTVADASMRATTAELPQTDASIPDGADTDNLGIKRSRSASSAGGNSVAIDGLASKPRSRIIYLKDFGAMAPYARNFLRELILAVRSRRTALSSSDAHKPYEVHKIQPTVIVLGVSRSLEHSRKNRGHKNTRRAFVDGIKKTDYESLRNLCPQIDQPSVSSEAESITNILGNALLAAPNRVNGVNTSSWNPFEWYIPSSVWGANDTSDDPDMGHNAIYRRIIGVLGFFDSRDPPLNPEQGDKGEPKPDLDLWRKGEAMAQKERTKEYASACFAANEDTLRKALTNCGGKVQEGFGVFSALPEGNPTPDHRTGSKKSKKEEKLGMEKFGLLFGLRSDVLPRAVADQIAATALFGPPPIPTTPKSVSSRMPPNTSTSSSPSASTKVEERVISPEDIAAAFSASINAKHELDQWLDNYEKPEKGNERSEKKKEDPVVAKVRSRDNLNTHEETLLQCVVDTTQLDTCFEDVCIDSKIMEGVRSIISLPLMYPAVFATGIFSKEALSGILLYGPPGTGKTMLCRAIAKEYNIRMLLIAPSVIEDKYVGETEKLVTATFSLARKIAPCVIFIDEVDAIFGARTSDSNCSSRYHRSMLTQFMQEMDGLNSATANKKKGIIVIGATNRPYDLDDAILRRLPCRMLVDLPSPQEREAILKVHLRGENVEGVDFAEIAQRAGNYSGSDLKNLAVCAALESLKGVIPEDWDAKEKRTPKNACATDSDGETGSTCESDGDGDEEGADDQEEEDTHQFPPRIIRPAHFEAALRQVTATCLRDMESVQKLRTWASKFSRNSLARYGTDSANSTTTPTYGSSYAGGSRGAANPTGPTPARTNVPYQSYRGTSDQSYRGGSNVGGPLSTYSSVNPTGSSPVGNAPYQSYRRTPNHDGSLSTYPSVNPTGSIPAGGNTPHQSYRVGSNLDGPLSGVNPTGSTSVGENAPYWSHGGTSNVQDSASPDSNVQAPEGGESDSGSGA